MEFDHSPLCPHCQAGCQHPHTEDDPLKVLLGAVVPTVRGSRMRHGGSFTCPDTGITIGTDRWRQVRCVFCRTEAMTPVEVIPPFAEEDTDGAILSHCATCQSDMESGHRPGHNRHRRRRRRG